MLTPRSRRGRATERPVPEWTRQKMLALLIGAGIIALAFAVGLVLVVVSAVTTPRHTASYSASHGSGPDVARDGIGSPQGDSSGSGSDSAVADARNALADKAMPAVSVDDSHPGPASITNPEPSLTLPNPSATGPAGVPSGFPHTALGAMGQLAAIDQTAIQSGSLAAARQVITDWAMPGGPTASSWSVIAGLNSLLASAGLSGGGSTQLAVVLTPLMGLVKGTVGADFVVPCIDFELDVTLAQTARGATADCQRMVWNPTPTNPTARAGGRWLIGPGTEPATPPSVWPDTDVAISVGYRDLLRAGS